MTTSQASRRGQRSCMRQPLDSKGAPKVMVRKVRNALGRYLSLPTRWRLVILAALLGPVVCVVFVLAVVYLDNLVIPLIVASVVYYVVAGVYLLLWIRRIRRPQVKDS